MVLSTTHLKNIAIPILLVGIFIYSCTNTSVKNIQQDQKFLIEQGDINWNERQLPFKAKLASIYYGKAINIGEPNLELSTKFLHASYYYSHYIETDFAIKDSIFLQAANHALNVIHNTDEFYANNVSYAKSEKEIEILTINSLDKNYVPILYWWIANMGRYLINKPISERLQYTEIIQAGLNRLIELDPNYYYGGPYRLLGTFYVRVPGFDIDTAKSYFQKSYDTFPNCFSTSVLMAQYCCTKANNREHFHSLLQNVVNSDPNLIFELGPENAHEQKFAKELLNMEFLLFE